MWSSATSHPACGSCPGDVVYLYENIEGIGGDGRYVPIGLAMGSQEKCLLALDELMRVTGGQTSRILPGHENSCGTGIPPASSATGCTWPSPACAPASRAGSPGTAEAARRERAEVPRGELGRVLPRSAGGV
jgi:hypothetical protein